MSIVFFNRFRVDMLTGVSSGHYTAYTKHVNTGEWHYYNDETVLTRTPQEEDFSNGYVLFYQRRTITCPAKVPEK